MNDVGGVDEVHATEEVVDDDLQVVFWQIELIGHIEHFLEISLNMLHNDEKALDIFVAFGAGLGVDHDVK